MRLAERTNWLSSVMTRRTPQPNSTRIWRSDGWRISISTKVTSATRHGAGMDEEDIPRDYGWCRSRREISCGAAFPSLTPACVALHTQGKCPIEPLNFNDTSKPLIRFKSLQDKYPLLLPFFKSRNYDLLFRIFD